MIKTLFILKLFRLLYGIEFAYNHFAEGESPSPPFIAYLTTNSNNFSADGEVYYAINQIDLELYTDKKEPQIEEKLERLLNIAGVFYEKSEIYIKSERLYEVIYSYSDRTSFNLDSVRKKFIDEFSEREADINEILSEILSA